MIFFYVISLNNVKRFLNLFILISFFIIIHLKFPSTVILDYKEINYDERKYWLLKYLLTKNSPYFAVSKFIWFENDLSQKYLFTNTTKFTLHYSFVYCNINLNEEEKEHHRDFFVINQKFLNRTLLSNHLNRQILKFINRSDDPVEYRKIRKLFERLDYIKFSKKSWYTNLLPVRFNIMFFKKEKLYTKLKYSRVPQYDLSAGAGAAILSGFLGYLITEKFGVELVDSGDFWVFFMYLCFFIFSLHPLLKMNNSKMIDVNPWSHKWIYLYFQNVSSIIVKTIHRFFKTK